MDKFEILLPPAQQTGAYYFPDGARVWRQGGTWVADWKDGRPLRGDEDGVDDQAISRFPTAADAARCLRDGGEGPAAYLSLVPNGADDYLLPDGSKFRKSGFGPAWYASRGGKAVGGEFPSAAAAAEALGWTIHAARDAKVGGKGGPVEVVAAPAGAGRSRLASPQARRDAALAAAWVDSRRDALALPDGTTIKQTGDGAYRLPGGGVVAPAEGCTWTAHTPGGVWLHNPADGPGSRYFDTAEEAAAALAAEAVPPPVDDVPAADELLARGGPVNHPAHYNAHPAGIEAIDVIEHFPFNVGTAMKYEWRAGLKGGEAKAIEDLEKAGWYIRREIERLKKFGPKKEG